MNLQTGQPDPRSSTGQFARGKNMYPGGNSPRTTTGPQSKFNNSPVGENDPFRAAVLRRLVDRFGLRL